MNIKKIIQTILCVTCISILRLPQIACDTTSDEKQRKKRVSVYSHGFGEYGPSNGPTYPDAPGQVFKACFYTKPAVHELANYLKDKLDEGNDTIDLEGRSCGAGTVINCLDKLINYDQNPDYFATTKIISKSCADEIIAAINRGSIDLTVPFLSLKKAKAVSIPSGYLSTTSIVAACGVAHCRGMFGQLLEKMHYNSTSLKNLAVALATGVVAHYTLGSIVKNSWATVIDGVIMPCISRFNYDPFHAKPLDSVERLRGHITCPLLLHVCKNDRVLENPDEDTVKLYDALRTGNESKTHIVLSEPTDGWHNAPSFKYLQSKKAFNTKYGLHGEQCNDKNNNTLLDTQPTPEELRLKICSPGQ